MTTITWNPTYFADKGYLAYSIQHGEEKGWSGMGWDLKQFAKIEILIGTEKFNSLSAGEKIEISGDEMKTIHSLWSDLRYKKFKLVYIPREAKKEVAEVLYEAWETRRAVMLEYEEGYEMYPSEEDEDDGANVSDNGLVHVAYIGKSTGTKPILLHIAGERSCGGGEFMFAGLKSAKLLGGCRR